MALRSSVLVTELCIEGSNPMFTVLVCLVLVKMLVKRYTGYSIVNTVLPEKFCKFGFVKFVISNLTYIIKLIKSDVVGVSNLFFLFLLTGFK